MAILDIVVWPSKALETPAKDVTIFDNELKTFIADMHETMRAANGIGLAANQVGVLKRVITMEIPWVGNERSEGDGDNLEKREWWHDQKFTFVNPVITKKAGKFRFQEGCLSFPEIYEYVDRAAEVWVTAKDQDGKDFEVHANDLFAVCLQHEIDHIDGVVFFNRMSRLKQNMVKKKMLRRGTLKTVESVES